MPIRLIFFLVITSLVLVGCQSVPKPVRNLAKSDVDFVTDVHVWQLKVQLETMTRKLYVRNPRELEKALGVTVEDRMKQIFGSPEQIEFPPLIFDELYKLTSIDAILLGLDPDFEGDRVFAVMVGLTEMLRKAYNHQQEFFLLDSLDEQVLYNSARNIEILVWRLYHRTDTNGELLLLTNQFDQEHNDLSFDRVFTKMIQTQDLMAEVVADKTNRGITKVIQGAAQMAFLPIP